MSKDDIQTIINGLRDALYEPMMQEARHRADEGLARVLNLDDWSLRNRVDEYIRKTVAERVAKHIKVTVEWVP